MFNPKKKTKAVIVSLLIMVLLFTTGCGKSLPEKVPDLRDSSTEYVLNEIAAEPVAGEDDMAVFNLLKSKSEPDKAYRKDYLKSAEKFASELKEQKDISYRNVAFTAMTVKEAGGDPRDVKGVNLMEYLNDFDRVRGAGPEAECYAIIGMKYCGEETESLYKYDEDILNIMISGNEYKGKLNEAEFRGLTLIAMSYYQTLPEVAVGIDGTLNRLRELQKEDGGFGNCKVDATVAAGLAAISVDSYEFKQNEESGDLLTSLMSYREKDGFKNKKDRGINEDATVRALTVLNMYTYKVVDEKNFLVPEE